MRLKLIIIFLLLLFGCEKKSKPKIIANHTTDIITIDGKLQENCWQTAEVYSLSLSHDKLSSGEHLENFGEVRMLWNDSNIYIGIKYFDEDVVALGTADEQPHYLRGDVCEVFIKPKSQPWYWELYSTPHSKQTTMYFSGGGRLGLPEDDTKSIDMKVAGFVDGTLNNYQDKDKYWSSEILLPINDTANNFCAEDFLSEMTILIARYNYSIYIDHVGAELSMFPPLSKSFYHMTKEYAEIDFIK